MHIPDNDKQSYTFKNNPKFLSQRMGEHVWVPKFDKIYSQISALSLDYIFYITSPELIRSFPNNLIFNISRSRGFRDQA